MFSLENAIYIYIYIIYMCEGNRFQYKKDRRERDREGQRKSNPKDIAVVRAK